MLGGPGGAGKSQVFAAITEFYKCVNHIHQLKICGPISLAANNVGGSTCHSEASLCISRDTMHAAMPSGETVCTNLEQRWRGYTGFICDEINFLGLANIGYMSENIKIATQIYEDSGVFGNLTVIFAGDPAQLPPPKAKPLYDHYTLTYYKKTSDLNALSTKTK